MGRGLTSSLAYVNVVDVSDRRSAPPAAQVDYDALLALFFFAWRGFAAEPDAILAREGLGRVHHRVLYAIARVPGICVSDLAASLGITRQALHRPLAELHRRRLVLSTVSAESARERELRVTPRGADLEDKASGAQREQLRRVFSSVGPAAAEGWARVMEGLAGPIVSRSPGRVAEMVTGQ
jgi:DNA-binding MarR family transcriptional regulator